MVHECMEVSCAILAGGKSSRMGSDKATTPLARRPMIRHVYDVARKVFADIVVVSSLHEAIEDMEATFIPDALPVRGSLTGIVTALLHARTPYVFILGCDMPFLSEEVLRYVIAQIDGEDVIVPKTRDGLQLMHAVYNRSCLPTMLSRVEQGEMRVRDVLSSFKVKIIEADEFVTDSGVSVFTNVNTSEDLQDADRVLR
jgi:molybdopterin-guanine dinucleotide biosynthesis protein A